MSSLYSRYKAIYRRGGVFGLAQIAAERALRCFMPAKIYQARKLRRCISLHNYSYGVISDLVVKLNDGLHPKHDIIRYHDFFVSQIAASNSVLDLGCGNGFATYDIAGKAELVVGIDINAGNIDYAKRNFLRNNLQFIVGDVMSHKFERQFDVAVLSNVLEHIDERVALLRRVGELADKLLLRVPMLTRDWLVVYKKEHGFEYKLDPTHRVEYTLADVEQEAQASGWRIKSYQVNWGEFWGVMVR